MSWSTAVWRFEGKKRIVKEKVASTIKRRCGFVSYVEPFRALSESEKLSLARLHKNRQNEFSSALVSYQAQTRGFTICNIILDNKLYSGSSHCSKMDRWLPIRGKMLAFRRALESEGVELSQPLHITQEKQ